MSHPWKNIDKTFMNLTSARKLEKVVIIGEQYAWKCRKNVHIE